MNVEAFIRKVGITMVARPRKPVLDPEDKFAAQRGYYRCTFERRVGPKAVTFTVDWTSGAPASEPKAVDVLENLQSDSNFQGSFEEFCGDFGYDEDSRKAEKIYKAINSQNRRLKTFLGEKDFEMFQLVRED